MQCPSCEHPNVDNARFCAKCGALLPVQSAVEDDPMIGVVIKNTFRVVRLLGEGGMGRVYEGEQQMGTTTRKVAIKTLHPHLSQDPQIVARFNRECGTVAQLEHPNTIQFFDFGQAPDGTLFIAMEFIDGESICDIVEREGPMDPERVALIMRQVCGSLAEAHNKGIIHRDLKPDNIVLTTRAGRKDFAKVLDFGIAARTEATDAKKEQKLTQQGTVLGTPPYMSPEQFTGKELDNRSDIYSLGVMTYEMLTGKLPFDAETPWEWATKHLTERPYPFEVTAPRTTLIPEPMKQSIMRALSKEPNQRQSDVMQFFEEFSAEASAAVAAGLAVADHSPSGSTGTAAMEAPPPELLQAAAAAYSHPGTLSGPQPTPPYGNAPGYGAPPMQAVAPHLAPAPAFTPPVYAPPPPATQQKSGGSTKWLLIAAAAVAVVLGVLAVVLVMKTSPKDDGSDGRLSLDLPMEGGVTELTPLASAAPIPTEPPPDAASNEAAQQVATAAAKPATTTKPAATKPSTAGQKGDAACDKSIALARAGQIEAAVREYGGCTQGGSKARTAKSIIQAEAPKAAQQAVFRGDCKRAQSIARSASSIGVGSNATSIANKCK